jgi:putative iron-dependent peroxidase
MTEQPPVPQAVLSPLTGSAVFLVVTIDPGAEPVVRELLPDLAGLVRAVGFRIQEGTLTCVTGVGSAAWDRLFSGPRPAELHPFREVAGARHTAIATPGDLLFHIRAGRMDLCFELASQIMERLRGAVTVRDEVHGFKYFDERDLLGFVDGTENPTGPAASTAVMIGADDPRQDPDFTGGSYVIVQKYLHDLTAWNALPVETQERAVGRTKLSDIELPDDVKPTDSHVALNTITDPDGTVSSARTSSATPAPRTSLSGCWRTCSSVIPRAITTGCSTSPPRSPEVCSTSPPPTSSTTRLPHRRPGPRKSSPQWFRWHPQSFRWQPTAPLVSAT